MINNLSILKKRLREEISIQNKNHSNINFEQEDKKIINKIISTNQYKMSDTILLYYPIKTEVNTISLINIALKDNKSVALPRITNDKMEFIIIDKNWESHLSLSKYKILEPISDNILTEYDNNCLMIVPNLALGKDLTRIGHGKGYYDKFLSDKKNIFKIGICRSYLLYESVPTNEDDIKMDLVITS